jgi:hypothetical protein
MKTETSQHHTLARKKRGVSKARAGVRIYDGASKLALH